MQTKNYFKFLMTDLSRKYCKVVTILKKKIDIFFPEKLKKKKLRSFKRTSVPLVPKQSFALDPSGDRGSLLT